MNLNDAKKILKGCFYDEYTGKLRSYPVLGQAEVEKSDNSIFQEKAYSNLVRIQLHEVRNLSCQFKN